MPTKPMALLVIDAQVNMFDPGHPVEGAPALLERLAGLVARARAAATPVVFVRNCGGPEDPDPRGSPGWELHPALRPAPGERVLDKTTCDTFASTSLGDDLADLGVGHVVVAGLQSEYCIRETTSGARSRSLAVTLVADGHATYPGRDRSAGEISAGVNEELAGAVRLVPAGAVRFE